LPPATLHNDGTLRTTRWLAIVVVSFLIVTSAILYLRPNDTGRLFAGPIKPSVTAMMPGAAYMGWLGSRQCASA